jgi:hypothetical protein
MRNYTVLRCFALALCLLEVFPGLGQSTYPGLSVNQSFTPPSPNAQAFQSYDDNPIALYTGLPSVTIPIYTVKCGALTVPISLSYNSNGFFPLQDAGWVGLGWSLNAGGAVSRIVEGDADGSLNSGHNYGQYNLGDSVFSNPNVDSFLQKAYNMNLAYGNNTYDLAPDIFDAEFNGIGDQFFWVSGQAYLLSYNKQLSISWPSYSSNIVITTEDGTQYTFGATETTTDNYYGGSDSISQSFTSAWFLTQMVSVQGDTIKFNYASYTWQQTTVPYQASYTMSTTAGQPDLGYDPNEYQVHPSITTQVLQSIVYRNGRVSFIPDPAGRTDINGTLPRLREIVVIDSLTGDTVKKNFLSYKYFGLSTVNPKLYERLALKTFSSVSPLISSDSLTYTFKYINESDTALNVGTNVGFPAKSTYGTDYWGYYNGANNNSYFIPAPSSIYYSPAPPAGASFSTGVSRSPSFGYLAYGLLDTIVYPTSGYTAFQYEQNLYRTNSLGTNSAPGVCLQSNTMFDGINPNPVLQKNYTYLQDNGDSTSGLLTNIPNYNGPLSFVGTTYSLTDTVATNYSQYAAPNASGGIGGTNPIFYYSKVTETVTSNGETHKTDHYFTQYPEIIPDVRETKRIDYINTVNTNIYTPVSKTVSNYTYLTETSVNFAVPYIDSENVNAMHSPKVWYAFGVNYENWNVYWVYPTSQQTTLYDANGDSLTTTTNYYFNSTTHNLAYTETQGSDGQTMVQKFKYPEDYISGITGNMVSHNVIGPVIENENWLKQNSSDSVLIAGSITEYDQTIFKPDTTYAVETTVPIGSLSNQTTSGGLYSSLLCDAHYVRKGQLQYDGNTNLSVATKASDIPVSYIWDYRHSCVIAEVSNAAPSDIAYSSFEADGTGNWTVKGGGQNAGGITGNSSRSMHLDTISKSGLTSTNTYVVSYWTSNGSAYSIAGTIAGYPIQGKRINGWSYFEHKITGQTSVSITGSGNIDELRLYPANAQMVTYTYTPLVGVSTKCDADNRATYYQYDPFGRLKVVLDQDFNIIKTIQYHTIGETVE